MFTLSLSDILEKGKESVSPWRRFLLFILNILLHNLPNMLNSLFLLNLLIQWLDTVRIIRFAHTNFIHHNYILVPPGHFFNRLLDSGEEALTVRGYPGLERSDELTFKSYLLVSSILQSLNVERRRGRDGRGTLFLYLKYEGSVWFSKSQGVYHCILYNFKNDFWWKEGGMKIKRQVFSYFLIQPPTPKKNKKIHLYSPKKTFIFPNSAKRKYIENSCFIKVSNGRLTGRNPSTPNPGIVI